MKKTLVLLLVALTIALSTSACDALKEECEKNNTGTFYITNNSQKGRSYKILIDGMNYGIVGAGDTKEWTLAAGPHVVQILNAEDNSVACTISVPTVIKCQKNGLTCSG